MLAALPPLDRKLLRDLWHMRGQVLAIAAVIMGGVATLVMSLSTYDSLTTTRDRFYRDYRFAEVFGVLKRAPEPVAERLRAIPGVEQLETRIRAGVKLEVAGFGDPITGLLLSLPDSGAALLNGLHLKRGRMVQPYSSDEAVLSDTLADAHRLEPGDRIAAIINGKRKALTVVGIAVSPEYVYQIAPGAMFPDFKRYGVLWMGRNALAAAYDMEGAFNNVTATLARGAQLQDVIDRIDGVLAAYGGTGAYPRKDQFSNRFLLEELKQLQTTATIFPAIFLGVAAVLLNVVISRLSALQRDQIAILKAFGYTTAAISGTLFAVLRAARLAPAEGMRPETPAVYRATVLGISCACGVMMVGNYQKGGDRFHGRRAVPPGGARGSRPDLHRAHLGQGAVRAGRPAGRDACRRLPRRAGHPALREPQLPFGRVRHPARRPAAPLARPQPAAGAGARRRRGADRPPGQQDAARAARPDADHRDPRRAPPHRRGAGARHHPAVPRRLRPTCGTSRSTRCCAKAAW